MKNKIGWCNLTFNPAWGCRNKCPYCYARKIAGFRYKQIAEKDYLYTHKYLINSHIEHKTLENGLKNFNLTFLKSHFDKKFPQKTQKIFVGSMSEIAHWEDEWLEKVLEKVKLYPQHIFQFLTRYPEVYDRYIFPKNCWLGVTITREKDFERGIPYLFITSCNVTFVSIEPILEYINPGPFSNANIDWVILGAETGKRKGKIIPKKEWIENIVNYCKWNNIPVYLKDSLKEIYPEEIKMFPEVK
jgi:protein gp37